MHRSFLCRSPVRGGCSKGDGEACRRGELARSRSASLHLRVHATRIVEGPDSTREQTNQIVSILLLASSSAETLPWRAGDRGTWRACWPCSKEGAPVNDSIWRPLRPRSGRSVLSISPLLALLALGSAVTALAAPVDHGASLRDGVLVAPDRGLAYVMRPGGGIDAIDLASGNVRWHSDAAAKPLAISGKRLIAQAESKGDTLDVVALDARRGAPG